MLLQQDPQGGPLPIIDGLFHPRQTHLFSAIFNRDPIKKPLTGPEAQAARNLSDEHWREFVRKSTETMHKQDGSDLMVPMFRCFWFLLLEKLGGTVDGQNPAPPRMIIIPVCIGF